MALTILVGLQVLWCIELGLTLVVFWADNNLEFPNMKMEELMSKVGIKMEFVPEYSTW